MNLAWKEMKYNKKNFILIGITIILMIFMVIFLSGLTNGLARVISAGLDKSGAEYFAVSKDAENIISASNISENDAVKISDMTGDKTALLNVKRSYITYGNSDEKEGIAYFGVDADEFISPQVTEGSNLSDTADTVVLNDVMKDKGIKVGDEIVDSASKTKLKVIGFTKDAYYSHTSVGYVSLKTYLNMEKKINPFYKTSYNALAIKGTDIDNIKLSGITVATKSEIVNNLPGYTAEKITINMIIWVLVIITGAILAVFFYIITLQKTKQYGVMKALGMKNGEIALILIKQVAMMSFIGTSLGVLLAYGLSLVLPSAMPFYFKLSDALIISGVFIMISIAGGILSVRRVAKVDPLIIIGGME